MVPSLAPIGIGGGIGRGILTGRRGIIGAGPGPGGGLQDEIPSTCFHLDATDADSYPGSGQTWANLIDTPADGSGQTDFDVWRGGSSSASTDDPTFNGTAGDSAAYWSFDGGDYFLSTAGSSQSPGFLNELHKTWQANGFWLATAWRQGSGNHYHFSNSSNNADNGFRIINNTDLIIVYRYRAGSTVQSSILVNSTNYFANGTDYLAIITMNAARNNIRWWIKSRTATDTTPPSWSSITADSTQKHALDVNYPSVSSYTVSGARKYAFAGGNDYIDSTAAGKIFDFFNTQHGRTYA